MAGDSTNRTIYFDYIRVFATFAMIILHVCGQNWGAFPVNSLNWQVYNVFDSIVRWAVPAFLMISGALFLGRDISLKKLYSKYILRLAVAFLVWAAIYAAFAEGSLKDRFWTFLTGHYHMWFVLMIIGIYICIPILKLIAGSGKWVRYYLILAGIFAFLIPEIISLVFDFGTDRMIHLVNVLNVDLTNMNMYLVMCCFPAYYVLGYVIAKTDLSKRQRMIIYIAGLIGFAATILLEVGAGLKMQFPTENYYREGTLNVLFETLAVFVWFKYRSFKKERLNRFVQHLSKYSFGAYLIHALVIEQFANRIGLHSAAFHPVLAVLCTAVLVFLISFAISAILNHIPIVKKYIV